MFQLAAEYILIGTLCVNPNLGGFPPAIGDALHSNFIAFPQVRPIAHLIRMKDHFHIAKYGKVSQL